MQILHDALWQFDGFLAPELCAAAIARAELAGLRPAALRQEGRHNEEAFLDWPELRDTVLRQLGAHSSECPAFALDATVLAPRLECYRYGPGDFIEAHRDAPRLIGAGTVSNLTLVVYLDEGAMGGETVFSDHGISVRPSAGSAVLFSQVLRHAAAPVAAGTKHVLRADCACPSRL